LADIEFTVEAILPVDGMMFVDGRVCNAAIRPGDVFTRLYGPDTKWDSSRAEWIAADPGPTRSVALRIESIESYRRFWDELSEGMTARIRLSGVGVEFLQQGKIIGGTVSREKGPT
jgi:hypothetical protein